MALVGDHLRGAIRLVGDHVAEGDDLHALDPEQLVQHRAPAQARANHPEANDLVPLERNAAHCGTSPRRRRRLVRMRRGPDRLRDGLAEDAARGKRGTAERGVLEEVAAREVRHGGAPDRGTTQRDYAPRPAVTMARYRLRWSCLPRRTNRLHFEAC